MAEETKRKQDEHEHEPGHKPDEDLCWSGHQCVPSLSVFTFGLSEFRRHRCRAHHRNESPMALHAVLGVALFLFGNIIAQDSSLAIRLHEPTSTGSLRSMSSTQATTSHTKQAARTPPRTSQAASMTVAEQSP